jgi:predicted DNA-binding transcriptional regulator AlpA
MLACSRASPLARHDPPSRTAHEYEGWAGARGGEDAPAYSYAGMLDARHLLARVARGRSREDELGDSARRARRGVGESDGGMLELGNVAELLDISRSTISVRVRRGQLPPPLLIASRARLRFREDIVAVRRGWPWRERDLEAERRDWMNRTDVAEALGPPGVGRSIAGRSGARRGPA